MVAEFESDLIRLRTVECMKVAKAKGRLRGKQPKLNRKQEAHVVSLVHSGEYSTLEVAELFGVGRSTVYRAIERQRIRREGRYRGVFSKALNAHGAGRPVSNTPPVRRRRQLSAWPVVADCGWASGTCGEPRSARSCRVVPRGGS